MSEINSVDLVFTAGAIAAGANKDSQALAMDRFGPRGFGANRCPNGYFSLDIDTSGAGATYKVEVLVTNKETPADADFVVSEGATPAVSGKAAGHHHMRLDIDVCTQFKIRVTAAGAALTINAARVVGV